MSGAGKPPHPCAPSRTADARLKAAGALAAADKALEASHLAKILAEDLQPTLRDPGECAGGWPNGVSLVPLSYLWVSSDTWVLSPSDPSHICTGIPRLGIRGGWVPVLPPTPVPCDFLYPP